MISYTSCTTTDIDEAGIYAEVKVLRHEKPDYNPLTGLSGRMAELNTACVEYMRAQGPFNPTELAEWIAGKLSDVREVGVFNADGSGVIISVESDHSI